MLRPRVSSLQRVSDWLVSNSGSITWPKPITAQPAGPAAPALHPAHLRQQQTAAPLSPLDRVKARVRDGQHLGDAQDASDTTAMRSSVSTMRDPQAAARVPPAGTAEAAESARITFHDQMTSATAEPAAVTSRQHWLDKHFPSARPWLQRKNIQWWLRGVQARCK
jgi:hypothetical protein